MKDNGIYLELNPFEVLVIAISLKNHGLEHTMNWLFQASAKAGLKNVSMCRCAYTAMMYHYSLGIITPDTKKNWEALNGGGGD